MEIRILKLVRCVLYKKHYDDSFFSDTIQEVIKRWRHKRFINSFVIML